MDRLRFLGTLRSTGAQGQLGKGWQCHGATQNVLGGNAYANRVEYLVPAGIFGQALDKFVKLLFQIRR